MKTSTVWKLLGVCAVLLILLNIVGQCGCKPNYEELYNSCEKVAGETSSAKKAQEHRLADIGRVLDLPAGQDLSKMDAEAFGHALVETHQMVKLAKSTEAKEEPKQDAGFLAWCDSIYHTNIACPKHGKVDVPLAVQAKWDAEHRAWCDSIQNRNVGCREK